MERVGTAPDVHRGARRIIKYRIKPGNYTPAGGVWYSFPAMSVDFELTSNQREGRLRTMAKTLGVSPSYVRRLADNGILPFRRTACGPRVFDSLETTAAFAKRGEG